MIAPLLIISILFWLIQVIDLLRRDVSQFESHTHKLAWFIALMVGNILGAAWYFHWKKSINFQLVNGKVSV